MKFCWCTITVNDLEASLRFYHEIVGLTIDREIRGGPGPEILFLGQGETKVELIYNNTKSPVVNKDGIAIGFEVESLDAQMELIKEKGLAIESGPFMPNPHVKFFFVRDPDGVSVQFVENSH